LIDWLIAKSVALVPFSFDVSCRLCFCITA
jgi:hypothetical protein